MGGIQGSKRVKCTNFLLICDDFRLNQSNFAIKWADFDLLLTKLQTSQTSLNDITIDLDGNWALSLIFSCTLYRIIQVARWMSQGARKDLLAVGRALMADGTV